MREEVEELAKKADTGVKALKLYLLATAPTGSAATQAVATKTFDEAWSALLRVLQVMEDFHSQTKLMQLVHMSATSRQAAEAAQAFDTAMDRLALAMDSLQEQKIQTAKQEMEDVKVNGEPAVPP